MLSKVIAPTLLELIKERGCPVGTVDLIAVIKEGMRIGNARLGKGFVETCQIVADGIVVKVVDYPALTTRCSPLHLLAGASNIDAVNGGTVYYGVAEDSLAGGLL